MTKLRLGILNLEIVLGRYEGIPREERFCKLCGSGLVEDGMHFVLVCNYFINERQSFIPRSYSEHPSEFKCCQLLRCSENSILNNLSKFLFHACKKRDMFCFFSSVAVWYICSRGGDLFSEVGGMKCLCESLKSKRAASASLTAWGPAARLRMVPPS